MQHENIYIENTNVIGKLWQWQELRVNRNGLGWWIVIWMVDDSGGWHDTSLVGWTIFKKKIWHVSYTFVWEGDVINSVTNKNNN